MRHFFKKTVIYLFVSLLLSGSAFAQAPLVTEKTYKIEEGHVKFGGYTLEYFSFNDKKIRCFNALNENIILYQFCNDAERGKKELGDNIGKVYNLNDSIAFVISQIYDDFIEVKVLSSQEMNPEVVSAKWFSTFLKLSSLSATSKIVAYPKDVIKTTIKLENNEPEKESKEDTTYKLYSVRPKGWDTSLKVDNNEVSSVNVAPGEEVTINAEITVPEDFSQDYVVVSIVVEGGSMLAKRKVRYDIPVVRGEVSFLSKLSSSTPEILSTAGEEVELNLELENSDYIPRQYNLSASAPENWNVSFYSSALKINLSHVSGKSTASIKAKVKIPSHAGAGTYPLTFKAVTKNSNAEYNVSVIVESSKPVSSLYSPINEVLTKAGAEVEFNLEIENNDYIIKQYSLNATAPENWNVSFYYSGLKVNTVEAPGKSTVSIKAKVEIPINTGANTYPLTFKAMNKNPNANYTVSVTVESSPPKSAFYTSTPEMIAKPGDEVKLGLDLKNEGKNEEYYLLTVVAPQDWEVAFYHKNFKVPSVQLSPESSVSLEASVKVPKDTVLGDYLLTFFANGDKSQAKQNVTLHLEGSYNLVVELSKLYIRATAGEKEEIIARVVNKGETPLHRIELSMEIPDQWRYEVDPKGLKRLDAGKTADFSISILPSPDTAVGDYFLKLKAKAEQTKAEDVSLRVTIQQKSSYGTIGIFFALSSILVLLLIYKKFGRR